MLLEYLCSLGNDRGRLKRRSPPSYSPRMPRASPHNVLQDELATAPDDIAATVPSFYRPQPYKMSTVGQQGLRGRAARAARNWASWIVAALHQCACCSVSPLPCYVNRRGPRPEHHDTALGAVRQSGSRYQTVGWHEFYGPSFQVMVVVLVTPAPECDVFAEVYTSPACEPRLPLSLDQLYAPIFTPFRWLPNGGGLQYALSQMAPSSLVGCERSSAVLSRYSGSMQDNDIRTKVNIGNMRILLRKSTSITRAAFCLFTENYACSGLE